MKIAINGEIVDTCDFYKIGNIEKDIQYNISFKFVIYHMNNKTTIVSLNSQTSFVNNGVEKYAFITRKELPYVPRIENGTIEDCINSEIYQENLKKITDFRESIIKIWSENQTTIPQFNLL